MPLAPQGINYRDEGAGAPVLLVHGWCMSSAVWELQRSALCRAHRMIAPDLRGHGASVMPPTGIGGFAGYADDIACLVEHLDLRDMTLVGWSLGAQVLLRAYPRLRERTAGLVLVGATPRFTAAAHFPWGLHPDEARGMALKVRRSLDRALEGFRGRMFTDDELNAPEAADRVAAVLASVLPPSTAAALDGLEALMEEELLAEARRVDCPTLIMHGDRDRICRPEAGRWLADAIPGSELVWYEGCGHAPFLSRPERFNADLLRFMESLHAGH